MQNRLDYICMCLLYHVYGKIASVFFCFFWERRFARLAGQTVLSMQNPAAFKPPVPYPVSDTAGTFCKTAWN